MQFIQAKNFTKVQGHRVIDVVVLHTMEAVEKDGTALRVAQWFAGPAAPQASAHYCIDAHEIIGCVRENDIAWAAPGANRNGIQLEHAGFAKQNTTEWSDAYSQQMLESSATLCAAICVRHGIPVVRLEVADLIAGRRGLCGHIDVTRAFKRSTHTDPGGDFPWDRYLQRVRAALPVDVTSARTAQSSPFTP